MATTELKPFFSRMSFVFGVAAFLISPPAFAKNLLESFEKDRIYYRDLTGKACLGDEVAVKALREAAFKQANGVALNNIAWLSENLDKCPAAKLQHDSKLITHGYRLSHDIGYPIGSYYYGKILLEGLHDTVPDPRMGLGALDEAIDGGYARAGAYLADVFIYGKYGQDRDLDWAEEYVTKAEAAGLDADKVARLRSDLATARATPSSPAEPKRQKIAKDKNSADTGRDGIKAEGKTAPVDPGTFYLREGTGERSWVLYHGRAPTNSKDLVVSYDFHNRDDCGLRSWIDTDPGVNSVVCDQLEAEDVFRLQGSLKTCRSNLWLTSPGRELPVRVYRLANLTENEAKQIVDWVKTEMSEAGRSSVSPIHVVSSSGAFAIHQTELLYVKTRNSSRPDDDPTYFREWAGMLGKLTINGCAGVRFSDGYLGGEVPAK